MIRRAFSTCSRAPVAGNDDGKGECKRPMAMATSWCLLVLAALAALLAACDTSMPTLATATALPSLSPLPEASISLSTRVPLSPIPVLPSASPSPEPSIPSPTQVPLPATAAPRTPAPSATAPEVTDLRPPLVVDGNGGRLYVSGRVEGAEQIVALAAADGHLLATYGITGTFDVDPTHDSLYVDRNQSGLLVLDAVTGARQTLVPLPVSRRQGAADPAPEADPATGQVLAFRDNSVYVIDPDQGAVVRTIPFDIPPTDHCRSLSAPLPIEWAAYDKVRRLLYLSFETYSCIPWTGESLVSFDMSENAIIAQQGISGGPATAFDGCLYGSGWYRMGNGYRWAWRDGRPWFESEGWNDSATLYVDAARGWLLECSGRVFDLETMSLLFIQPHSEVQGCPSASDPQTGRLYGIVGGKLVIWPANAIRPPSPQVPESADPPTKPVRQLIVSPAGPQAPALFGLWDFGMTRDACYLFGAQGGLLYQSADGGRTWARPWGGLGSGCDRISALAVSPDYVTDQTLFAALVGNGIFRSTDGGQLWQPASAGLTSMLCDEILLSPGFEGDQTVFARCESTLQPGDRYRSTDGGATWQRLEVDLQTMAMSPEFDRDGVLMGVSEGQVLVSRDRGKTWEAVGTEGAGASFARLSLAPLFAQWQVVFAFGGSRGSLYRSADGGRSWDVVLSVEESAPGLLPSQIVYGPETEAGRLLFLLATYTDLNSDPPTAQGTLYRSEDGGVSWEVLELPAGLVPMALAISPSYAEDSLLWLGTADGRVVSLQAANLHKAP